MTLSIESLTSNVHSTPFLGSMIDHTVQELAKRPPNSAPPSAAKLVNPKDVPEKVAVSGRIIMVTTNLPQVISKVEDKAEYVLRSRRGNSALYSAVNYLQDKTEWETVLVAWPGEVEDAPEDIDHLNHREKLTQQFNDAVSCQVEPVWLDGEDHKYRGSEPHSPQRWRQYAENIIWPILHYIQGEASDGRQEDDWWQDYETLNKAYRDKIVSIYRPGDIIWIHDYYLFLLPKMLRSVMDDAFIGLFMHAPFPSSEYFRTISHRRDLLEGILGASLVGTQSVAYSRHFVSSAARLLGVEVNNDEISASGVHVSVRTLPIGIDTVRVERDAFQKSVDAKVDAIRALYPGKRIIVGRDRLDSVRGVYQKLKAFEQFLHDYPEWREKVVLIQVTSPAYSNASKVDQKVSEVISRINGTYGMLHFAPVHHYPRHIARDEYLALLRVADLGLITSVRDGMNTTSLEFVVCQKYNKSPIILSEFTGTAGSLYDAIQVNPWDSTQVAATINRCLSMNTEERELSRQRQDRLYQFVTTHTVQNWTSSFVFELIHNLDAHDRSHSTPELDTAKMCNEYAKAKKRLFLFDYDGTLTPIVTDPAAALPSPQLLDTLKKLAADPRNAVWIISGRDEQFLDKWITVDNMGFSAEHGCFLKHPGDAEWENLVANIDMSWQKVVYDVFTSYSERTIGSTIEHKRAALTWHYRRADPDFGAFQAGNLRQHLEETVVDQYDVDVLAGKANIEVRPRQFNKGEIVRRLMQETPAEFVLCLGDDFTDEDMFKALLDHEGDGVFPVTVGPASKMTVAQWHVHSPQGVLHVLSQIVDTV
ncbi:trehalose-phosphatase [Trichomonascus vanleenenianus]|uniref:trehalose-phosphatase TPS2 n=1 Tax=Trichomonascus vanleenenianus TaxID=2268995 RepID=UPI003EC9B5E1